MLDGRLEMKQVRIGVLVNDSNLDRTVDSSPGAHFEAARLSAFVSVCLSPSSARLLTWIGDDVTCCTELLDGNPRVAREQ